jgi:hypothetical protein
MSIDTTVHSHHVKIQDPIFFWIRRFLTDSSPPVAIATYVNFPTHFFKEFTLNLSHQ